MFSEGRMKPSPMRPRIAQAISSGVIQAGWSGGMVTMSANDALSSTSPMLTSRWVGWRSVRRPTTAMVTASTSPAGSRMLPT